MNRVGKPVLGIGALAVLVAASAALAGDPDVICTGGPCKGTNGPDNIQGTDGRDVIKAKAGTDFVDAGAGRDEVDLGPGRDEVNGDSGRDLLLGGRGVDRFSGGDQADVIHGGPGDDREILTARGGAIPGIFTHLFGDPGDDKIYGDEGKDYMEGEEGADTLIGGTGADVLDAVDDDDDSVDRLRCGKGKDRYLANPEDIVKADCETEVKVKPRSPSGRP